MEFDLVVKAPFADYQVGQRITDPAKVAELRDSPFVVRVPKPVQSKRVVKTPETN